MFAARTRWETTANRLALALEKRRRQGGAVLDLTQSNPTRAGFGYDTRAILGSLADPAAITYEPSPQGSLTARQAVSEYYRERGVSVPPGRILLTSGTSEAYSYLFRLLVEPGEQVLAPAPSYPLLDFLAEINDAQLVRYPLLYEHGWRIDLEALAATITPRTRAIVVVSPNNPTGSLLQTEEIPTLVELARRREAAIIGDEVFADYVWGSAPQPQSLAKVARCLTFTLNGLSKIAALPQMKLAWIVANGPRQLLKDAVRRLEVISDTYLSVSAPVQHSLPRMLKTAKPLRQEILRRIRENLGALDRKLGAGSACSRLQAAGGWYAVLRVPSVRNDQDWAVELLEREGVYVHPGDFFDFADDGHLVLSLITPLEVFREGLNRLVSHIDARS